MTRVDHNDLVFPLRLDFLSLPGFLLLDFGKLDVDHDAVRLFLEPLQFEHAGIDMFGKHDFHPCDLRGNIYPRYAPDSRFVQYFPGWNLIRNRCLLEIDQDFFPAFLDGELGFITGVNHHSGVVRGDPMPHIQDLDPRIHARRRKTQKQHHKRQNYGFDSDHLDLISVNFSCF